MIVANGVGDVVESNTARSVVFAGNYLSKLSGEQIEHECRQRIAAGCSELVINFGQTEVVNSIAVSILLGVIDNAVRNEARVIFSDVNEDTAELFAMLGVTKHVVIE